MTKAFKSTTIKKAIKDPIKRLLKDNRQEQKRLKKLLNILQQDEAKWQQQITDPSWSQTVSGKGSRKKSKTGGGKAGLAKVKRTHLPS